MIRESEALELAAGVIDNAFGKDGYALNDIGQRTDVMGTDAVKFCLVGAVARVIGGNIADADYAVERWVTPLMPMRTLGYNEHRTYRVSPRAWNDDAVRTKEEVAAKLREAAAKAAAAGF